MFGKAARWAATTSLAVAALVTTTLGSQADATARPGVPAAAFPPKANSAWAYDTSSPGTWVDAIKAYNQQAGPRHELNEVYSYATDLEMYCPDNDGTQCSASDLYSYYTPGSGGRARTDAYYQAFDASGPVR